MNKRLDICTVKFCRKKRKRRAGIKKTLFLKCAKHMQQDYVSKQPYRAVWHQLRKHSKPRNIVCSIPFKHFRAFLIRENYFELKKQLGRDLTIDRVIGMEGYRAGNLQLLSRSGN